MVQWLSDKTDTTIFDILSWSLSTSNCLNEVAANQKNYEDVFFFLTGSTYQDQAKISILEHFKCETRSQSLLKALLAKRQQ